MIFALYLAFTASRKRRPAANGWGGLRPEICENLGGKSEKIIDFGLRKDAEGAKRTKIGSLRELGFLY